MRTLSIYIRFRLLWQLIANVDPALGDITVGLKFFHVCQSEGIAAHFLNLGSRWRSVVSFTFQLLYNRREPLVPIEWECRWAPELVWMLQGRDKSLIHSRNELAFIVQGHDLIGMLTVLFQLGCGLYC